MFIIIYANILKLSNFIILPYILNFLFCYTIYILLIFSDLALYSNSYIDRFQYNSTSHALIH